MGQWGLLHDASISMVDLVLFLVLFFWGFTKPGPNTQRFKLFDIQKSKTAADTCFKVPLNVSHGLVFKSVPNIHYTAWVLALFWPRHSFALIIMSWIRIMSWSELVWFLLQHYFQLHAETSCLCAWHPSCSWICCKTYCGIRFRKVSSVGFCRIFSSRKADLFFLVPGFVTPTCSVDNKVSVEAVACIFFFTYSLFSFFFLYGIFLLTIIPRPPAFPLGGQDCGSQQHTVAAKLCSAWCYLVSACRIFMPHDPENIFHRAV